MCGIVGIVSKIQINYSMIKSMNDLVSHRGPNDEGYLVSDGCKNDTDLNFFDIVSSDVNIALGHRRLSVVDLSANGHQPMSYSDRYWITYNGEIYNFLELRCELEGKGYSFKSNTDTEIILASYDYWGESCQNQFNGMWAFVIYDTLLNEIFISRDRFGIKPLFFFQSDDYFVFSSEIKPILQLPFVLTRPNIDHCKEYLNSDSLEYKRETFFENIFRFQKASCIKIKIEKANLPFKEIKYWDYEVNNSTERFNEQKAVKYSDEYYGLLKDSVRLRLRTDVAFGSTLSGGLDSSSIAYLIEQELSKEKSKFQHQSFSTVYSENNIECDESYYIKIMTDFLGIKSNKIEPNSEFVKDSYRAMIKSFESPPNGTSASGIATYKLISNSGVVVTLDGQGADEQQAGYLYYIVNYLVQEPLLSAIKESIKLRPIPGANTFINKGLMLNIASLILGKSLLVKVLIKFGKGKSAKYLLPLNERLKQSSNTSLINLIHYSDSRSMHHSIESRMPFMDYRLVEFTARVPAVYKIHNGWTKYFARLAFNKKLPDEITWRKDKKGWPSPEKSWTNGKLKGWLLKTVSESLFVQNEIKQVDLNNDLRKIGTKKAIKFLNLAIWYSCFFMKNK